MNDLPEMLKIGFLDYTIERFEPAIDADGTLSRIGECDRSHAAIRIANGLPDARAAEAMLHEVLHAAWDQWCNIDDEEAEERAVNGLSNALAAILRDNPEFARWLIGKLAPPAALRERTGTPEP